MATRNKHKKHKAVYKLVEGANCRSCKGGELRRTQWNTLSCMSCKRKELV